MHRVFCVAFVFVTIAFAATPCSAQYSTVSGIPPFGSFTGGPDVINLANLNVHMTIPVLHKPGRSTAFTYDFAFDSKVWSPVGSSGSQSWQPLTSWGWQSVTQALVGTTWSSGATFAGFCIDPNGQVAGKIYNYTGWSWLDARGANHPVSGTAVQAPTVCGGNRGFTSEANDGSGHTVTVTPGGFVFTTTVNTRENTQVTPTVALGSPRTYTDRNGNQITANTNNTFTDTLGTTVLTVMICPLAPRTESYDTQSS